MWKLFRPRSLTKVAQATTIKQNKLLVIGGSAGVSEILPRILREIPADLTAPIIVVRHISPDYNDRYYIESLNRQCQLRIKEADSGEALEAGTVYLAPANYHLLVEKNMTLSLTIDDKIKYCRPAIDPLFESAADACGAGLIAVLLTGANDDGSEGMLKAKKLGGYTIIQDPETASAPTMPAAALAACQIDAVLAPEEIASVIIELFKENG